MATKEANLTWLPSIRQLRQTTGFTAHPTTGIYDGGGYSVSPYPHRTQTLMLDDMDDDMLVDAIMAFAAENADLLAMPNHYVGGWHPDACDTQLTLDVAVTTTKRDRAETLRVRYGQADFYDFDAKMSRPHNIRKLVGVAS